jgi:hypothetical protein
MTHPADDKNTNEKKIRAKPGGLFEYLMLRKMLGVEIPVQYIYQGNVK